MADLNITGGPKRLGSRCKASCPVGSSRNPRIQGWRGGSTESGCGRCVVVVLRDAGFVQVPASCLIVDCSSRYECPDSVGSWLPLYSTIIRFNTRLPRVAAEVSLQACSQMIRPAKSTWTYRCSTSSRTIYTQGRSNQNQLIQGLLQIRLPQAQSMLFPGSGSASFGPRIRWGWLRQYVGGSGEPCSAGECILSCRLKFNFHHFYSSQAFSRLAGSYRHHDLTRRLVGQTSGIPSTNIARSRQAWSRASTD